MGMPKQPIILSPDSHGGLSDRPLGKGESAEHTSMGI